MCSYRRHNLLTSSTVPSAHCLINIPAMAVSGGTRVRPLPSPLFSSPSFLSDGASAFAVSAADCSCECEVAFFSSCLTSWSE